MKKLIKINGQLDIKDYELTENFIKYELFDIYYDLYEKTENQIRKSSVDTILELENHGFKVEPRYSEEKDWIKKYATSDGYYGKLGIYYKDIYIQLFHDFLYNEEVNHMIKNYFKDEAKEKNIDNKEIEQALKDLYDILNNHYQQMVKIHKYYINVFIKELEKNSLYNPSVDKHKKPYYFNDENIKLKITCYFSNDCYKIYDENDKEYPRFPVIFDFYSCHSIRKLLKTECKHLKSYYKIYKFKDKTFAVLKTVKNHELKAIIKIESKDNKNEKR